MKRGAPFGGAMEAKKGGILGQVMQLINDALDHSIPKAPRAALRSGQTAAKSQSDSIRTARPRTSAIRPGQGHRLSATHSSKDALTPSSHSASLQHGPDARAIGDREVGASEDPSHHHARDL